MKTTRTLATAVAIALLAGCGGGSSSPIAPTQAKTQPVTGASNGKKQSVTITFNIGKSRANLKAHGATKSRKYISPGTMGAVVIATSDNGTPATATANSTTYGYDLTDTTTATGSSTCAVDAADGSRTCSLVFPLNPDSYDITVTTYDQAQTNGSATAPTGKPLSTQTLKNQTISSNSTNTFAFQLGAYVEGFIVPGETGDSFPSIVGANGIAGTSGVVGATGGTGQTVTTTIAALDEDGYQIDQYAGAYPYANPYSVSIEDGSGQTPPDSDASGCSSAAPCVSVQPGTETTISSTQPSPAPTSLFAKPADETLTYSYFGGGNVGSGIENATNENVTLTTGVDQRPYYATVMIEPTASVPGATTNSGIFSFIVPLYAYATTTTATSNDPKLLVWAAQSSPPGGADYNGGTSYTALFPANPGSPGSAPSTTCYDANGVVVMSVDPGVYHKYFGKAYSITMASGNSGTCTLTFSDGATSPSTATLTLTNGTPGVVIVRPSPSASPLTPTGT